MRSGTHIMIDLILNNFAMYKGSPLYINLDMVLHFGAKVHDVTQAGGSVIKTHFPQSIECRGHETEIREFLHQQKVILVTREMNAIKKSLKRFGEWGANESTKFDQIHTEFDDYWNNEHKGSVLRVDYADLIQAEKVPGILREIERFTGLTKNSHLIGVIKKEKRFAILLWKALTRLLGCFSPRINTGIQLGK